MSINQSINQSTEQLINQSINRTNNQSINQWVDRSMEQSINQSINQYTAWHSNQQSSKLSKFPDQFRLHHRSFFRKLVLFPPDHDAKRLGLHVGHVDDLSPFTKAAIKHGVKSVAFHGQNKPDIKEKIGCYITGKNVTDCLASRVSIDILHSGRDSRGAHAKRDIAWNKAEIFEEKFSVHLQSRCFVPWPCRFGRPARRDARHFRAVKTGFRG